MIVYPDLHADMKKAFSRARMIEELINKMEQRHCSRGHGMRACAPVNGEWLCLVRCLKPRKVRK
jgi:hypothetical protein